MKERSKTGLFLMELILMVLVFSFSAAACLRVFAYARKVSDYSEDLNEAVLKAQSAAEAYKAAGGDLEKACGTIAGSADLKEGQYRVGLAEDASQPGCAAISGGAENSAVFFFDSRWNPVPEAEACFTLRLEEANHKLSIDVEKQAAEEKLFTLQVKAVDHGK
ncbi:MAG: hypothetical protein VB085_06895 [Peptococcaceae bacterium]|nr:hypothetical protein [Peptococcaceae bacterium]